MQTQLLALFLVACLLSPCEAKEFGNVKVSTVTTIYDGDTFTATIDEWPEIIGKSIGVRVAGIDTPELRGKCRAEIELARKAKRFTVEKLRSAKVIELRHLQRDKYFRLLAVVHLDSRSLGDQLIAAGLAVPYSGGTKVSWCKGNL